MKTSQVRRRRRAAIVSKLVPLLIGGAFAGYRADLGVTKDGSDRVSQWRDLTRNGHHASAAAAQSPLWVSSGLIGARPAMRFAAGGGDRLDVAALSVAHAQPLTVYAVFHATALGAPRTLWDTVNAAPRIFQQVTSTDLLMVNAGTLLSDGAAEGLNIGSCTIVDGASSFIFKNDFLTAAVTGAAGANAMDSLRIGDRQATGAQWEGDIAELWFFDGAHDKPKRERMRDYFNARYGLGIV